VPTTGGIRFRLWAPGQRQVRLSLGGTHKPMMDGADGWFETTQPADWGADYAFVLDDGRVVPDPAARAQVGDVHSHSRLVDPDAYQWKSEGWALPFATSSCDSV
jgi:1,4-alpha-glucan branching enzyme